MAGVIMVLDVLHIDGRCYARLLIKVTNVTGQVRVVGDPAKVALEVSDINRIKSHQRGEKPPVRLGYPRTRQIAAAGQHIFKQVECLKEGDNGFLIGFLSGGETRLVDTIVQSFIDPRVDLVDTCP